MRRVYTKRRSAPPDFKDPIVLTAARHGFTVKAACLQLHKSLAAEFNYALVWGASAKHNPQVRAVAVPCTRSHEVCTSLWPCA